MYCIEEYKLKLEKQIKMIDKGMFREMKIIYKLVIIEFNLR